MIARAWHHVGRRGVTLLFLGLLDGLFGYSFLVSPVIAFRHINYLLPYQTWGLIWIAGAVICFGSAPLHRDRLAFTVESALMSSWGAVTGYTWIVQHIPRAWVASVIWIAFAGLVLVISSWPESNAIHYARAQIDEMELWTPER